MIIQTILGHKVAAIGAALVLGTTTAAVATTGNVPFAPDDPGVEVEATGEDVDEETSAETGDTASDTDAEEDTADGDADGGGDGAAGDEPPAEDDGADDVATDQQGEVLPPVNEEGQPYGDVPCEDAENHGDYVSGVARDDSIEGNRGETVSQAARTSCGKHDAETAEAPGTDSAEDEDGADDRDDDAEPEADETEDADDGERAERDNGHGNDRGNGSDRGNGNGNGNGNGRGNDKKND